jgi:DNA-3-methyladenine glycosylase II
MLNRFTQSNYRTICDELALRDPDLAAIINIYGYPPFWNRPNTFETLVHIILEQQVSLASALSALNKLKEQTKELTPENLLLLTDEEMRASYCSRQKTLYIRHLAEAIVSGKLSLTELEELPDDIVRAKQIALKGIGHWTIDIYLIFVLRHPDVFPVGDLAVVNALKRIKKLPASTTKDELTAIAENWRPYRTLATMLLWHYYLSVPKKNPSAL